MDFTEIYQQSSSLVSFSPGTQWILTAVQDRIIVRRTDSLQITRTWLLDASRSATNASLTTLKSKPNQASNSNPPQEAWISHLGWSCDSEYILAACAKRGVVHLKKLQEEQWTGRIDCGAEGNTVATFSPERDPGLGIRCVAWHPSGMFLAVGGWDDKTNDFMDLTRYQ
ncbi:hypothetical protein H0H87_009193 [Tephrocybe sp. NHM501043]|nr:hypothetical protein H0H87_009193 [Tephrocybe sp. NHM501043]